MRCERIAQYTYHNFMPQPSSSFNRRSTGMLVRAWRIWLRFCGKEVIRYFAYVHIMPLAWCAFSLERGFCQVHKHRTAQRKDPSVCRNVCASCSCVVVVLAVQTLEGHKVGLALKLIMVSMTSSPILYHPTPASEATACLFGLSAPVSWLFFFVSFIRERAT